LISRSALILGLDIAPPRGVINAPPALGVPPLAESAIVETGPDLAEAILLGEAGSAGRGSTIERATCGVTLLRLYQPEAGGNLGVLMASAARTPTKLTRSTTATTPRILFALTIHALLL
jgi:hypothetical protein